MLIPKERKKQETFDNAERVDQIFYLFAQRSYLSSLNSLSNKLPDDATVNPSRHKKLAGEIEMSVVHPDRAEASFEFGWNPDSGPLQLFSSYTRWLHTLLTSMGADEYKSLEWLKKVESAARKALFRELVSRKKDHQWLINYQLLSDNARIIDLLEGFTDPKAVPDEVAWKTYMTDLRKRPSIPIWGEEEHRLSIGDIYVEPDFDYSRQRHSGSVPLKPTAPLLSFTSGLLSQRRPSTELVFLMGGPGSGKTSAMEVLCSQLAVAAKTPVILVQAKRLNPRKGLMREVQTYLSSSGYQAVADMLPTAQDCVLAIDGFDELAHATLSTLEDFFREAHNLAREHIGSSLRILLSGRPTLFSANDVCIPPGSHVLTLKPFEKERVAEWSERWREAKGGKFNGALYLKSESADIQELATQPMLLYLMAKMHEEKEPIPTDFGAQGGTKFRVYGKILDWVCRRQREKGVSDASNQHLRRFLQVAGLTTHQCGQRILHWKSFAAALQASGIAEDPKEIDSKVYGTILSFAFTNIEERAWEFTHKSFGEALAAEAIGRVLEDISETGRYGEPWRLPLRSATSLWTQTFGPHFLTLDVLDLCYGWIATKDVGFIRDLLTRLVEIVRYLMGTDISQEITEVSQAWERSVLDVLGNAMRSWFALANAAMDSLPPKDLEAVFSEMAGAVSLDNFRRGVYVSNIVSPITTGESKMLFKHTSKLVRGNLQRPSDRYIRSLLMIYRYIAESGLYRGKITDKKTETHPIVEKWLRFYGHFDKLTETIAEIPLEASIKGVEEILLHVFEPSVNESLRTKLEGKGISLQATKEENPEKVAQHLFITLQEMIVELDEPPEEESPLHRYFNFARHHIVQIGSSLTFKL